MPIGHERLYRIRPKSIKDLPQPPLDSNIINVLQNGGLSEDEMKYLEKMLAKNKKALAQLQFYWKLFLQKQQKNS